MLHELRAAVRGVCHRPVLALAVIVTLTLGIGANTAIFSAVDAVLLKPLPYPGEDRLVTIREYIGSPSSTRFVAPGRLEEWHAQNRTLDGIAASLSENLTDTTGPVPERVVAMRTSPRFFDVLGVSAAFGRTFAPDEDVFGGPRAVVISHALWRRRYNADPTVIGRTMVLGGIDRTIVGVMPPSFRYPTAATEVWAPTYASETLLRARQARFYRAFGRLKPGVTKEQAAADLTAVQTRLGEQYPQTDKGWGATVESLKEEQIGGVRRSLWLLLGAVAFLLLAACGNVACLMLSEATRREHEVAVRFAIGASRATVIRQLLLEGLVLACGGALGGLVLAFWSTTLLRRAAVQLPRIEEIQINGWLVGFTLVLGVVTTLAFALAPALQATRLDPARAMSRGDRRSVGGRQTLRRVLVAAQVALAIVLLAGSGLLIRSFARLQQVPLGIDPTGVSTFRMSAAWAERSDAVAARLIRTIERLEAIPGVAAATLSEQPPAGMDFPPGEFQIVGRDSGEKLIAAARGVAPGYFRTLGIPVLQGETCSGAPPPDGTFAAEAVVTRAFVDRFFPGEDAIGHALTRAGLAPGSAARIVAVVGDVREGGAYSNADPTIYFCGYNGFWPDPIFIVRGRAGQPVSTNTIREAMREIEPQRAVFAESQLTTALDAQLWPQRLSAILLALFAATTLLLAAVGLYGVLAQMVSSRRREIGVRMAMGARPQQIVRSVVAQAATMTGVGVAAGLASALALAQFMTSVVFGVSSRDPLTFAVVPMVLILVAAAAVFVPARRAATIDPMRALREE